MDELTRFTIAADRMVAALNAGGATPETAAAFGDEVELLRYGWGQASDHVVEHLHGREALSKWLARSPATARFERRGDAIPLGDGSARQHYGLEMDGFRNGGRWRIRLDADGRVCWWEHRPGDLDPDIQTPEWRARVEHALDVDPTLRPIETDGDP
ncbi:MAG: hypothetical protein RIT45_3601 [Pseudomonadota bacterium]|jgi:hypothetical protein